MVTIAPYHTNASDYTTAERQVYHDHDECPEATRILPVHRELGTGNKRRCIRCLHLGQPETAAAQPLGPERETLRQVVTLLRDLRLARGELALHQHRAPDPERNGQIAALTLAIQALEAGAWPSP